MADRKIIYLDDAIDALAYFTEKSPTGRTAQEVVKDLPSAQPEIIRCKECDRYQTERCFMHIERLWELTPEDYCSYAERREDG